jgi:hypothetical protein
MGREVSSMVYSFSMGKEIVGFVFSLAMEEELAFPLSMEEA